jgi:hypothetical protein
VHDSLGQRSCLFQRLTVKNLIAQQLLLLGYDGLYRVLLHRFLFTLGLGWLNS